MITKSLLVLFLLLTSVGSVCAEEDVTTGTGDSILAWWLNSATYGGTSDNIDVLIQDIYNDTTNEREYMKDVYDCTNYAINLTHNLSDMYETGIVVRLSKSGDDPGHMMSWVRLSGLLYVIEPQSDLISLSGAFNASIDGDRFQLTYGTEELGWTEYDTTSKQ